MQAEPRHIEEILSGCTEDFNINSEHIMYSSIVIYVEFIKHKTYLRPIHIWH